MHTPQRCSTRARKPPSRPCVCRTQPCARVFWQAETVLPPELSVFSGLGVLILLGPVRTNTTAGQTLTAALSDLLLAGEQKNRGCLKQLPLNLPGLVFDNLLKENNRNDAPNTIRIKRLFFFWGCLDLVTMHFIAEFPFLFFFDQEVGEESRKINNFNCISNRLKQWEVWMALSCLTDLFYTVNLSVFKIRSCPWTSQLSFPQTWFFQPQESFFKN